MRVWFWLSLTVGCLMVEAVPAATVYVSRKGNDAAAGDSWAAAKRTIQAGVDAASAADTVLVSNGVYVLSDTIRVEHPIGELRGWSAWATMTVIDGSNAVPCLTASTNLTVRGLTFRRGYAGGNGGHGGGLTLYDGGLVADCHIISNRAAAGAGLYSYRNLAVLNCMVAHNRALYSGGGLQIAAGEDETIHLQDTVISNNVVVNFEESGLAHGGGIYLTQEQGSALIANCQIVNNRVHCSHQLGNASGGGLYVNYASALTVRNTLIADNISNAGYSGAWVALGTTFQNCTIAGNQAFGPAAGLFLNTWVDTPYPCRVENSIIYSNRCTGSADPWGHDIYSYGYDWFENVWVAQATNFPALPGTNITCNEDPRFLDGARERWQLDRISPCINAGVNRSWMVGARDLLGQARILNNIVDLGCYETEPSGLALACYMVQPASNQTYGAPATIPIRTFGYSLKPLSVTKLVVYADNTPLATVIGDDELTAVWSNVWRGDYTLHCQVWSEKGHTAVSPPVTVTVTGAAHRLHVVNDYDGDGQSDLAIYGSGYWFVSYMAGGGFQDYFGYANCEPVEGDFDADGVADQAIYQEASGYWGIRMSGAKTTEFLRFGLPGYQPVRGDFDGDGRADLAVYHIATGAWYYRTWTNTAILGPFYLSGARSRSERGKPINPGEEDLQRSIPVPGDYDGDGRTDLSEYKRSTGTWRVWLSSTGWQGNISFNGNFYLPAPGDYDGDLKTDLVVFAPDYGLWRAFLSTYGYQPAELALAPGGQPVRGDFDGDGLADLITYNDSTGWWQGLLTRRGWVQGQFGAPGWRPVQ